MDQGQHSGSRPQQQSRGDDGPALPRQLQKLKDEARHQTDQAGVEHKEQRVKEKFNGLARTRVGFKGKEDGGQRDDEEGEPRVQLYKAQSKGTLPFPPMVPSQTDWYKERDQAEYGSGEIDQRHRLSS